ncbi:hypothetical protein [Nocardioides sp.]|uniref:hypothetical protein n=1 Tax=Nocardioides sp. TaxID=35761 RepID=UPI00261D1095|nr:hypothetical protein [Nocardioides sp.]
MIEAQALRKLNAGLIRAGVSTEEHRDIVYHRLVPQMLAGQAARGERGRPLPIVVPPDLDGWIADLAQVWIDWVTAAGIHVVGDLDDLRARPRTGEWIDPDLPRPRRVMRLTNAMLVAAVAEAAGRRSDEQRLPARARRAVRRVADRFRPAD